MGSAEWDGRGSGGSPLPGCGAGQPWAAAPRRLRHQHGHVRRLDEAQAVVDANVQPSLPNRQRVTVRHGIGLQQADKGAAGSPHRALSAAGPEDRTAVSTTAPYRCILHSRANPNKPDTERLCANPAAKQAERLHSKISDSK